MGAVEAACEARGFADDSDFLDFARLVGEPAAREARGLALDFFDFALVLARKKSRMEP